MTPADIETLKARIEAALVDSAAEFGTNARPEKAPSRYAVSFDLLACHLVNHDDTRAVLTDAAVKQLGGRVFTVTLEEGGQIEITPAGMAKPEPSPAPAVPVTAKPAAPATWTPAAPAPGPAATPTA